MNTDEIVRALRDAEGNNELDCEISELRPLLLKAANLIESMQAQLSASQRRERAAVEDLKISAHCNTCVKKCGVREALSRRNREGGCKEYEWRGTQKKGAEHE